MRSIVSRGLKRFTGPGIVVVAGMWLAGCASPDRKPDSLAVQLESGVVELGATPSSVAEVIGMPHLKLVPPDDPRQTERWVYTEISYHEAGTITVGRYETLYDRDGRTYSHFIIPGDVVQHEAHVRVIAMLTFEDGKLVAIDLPKS